MPSSIACQQVVLVLAATFAAHAVIQAEGAALPPLADAPAEALPQLAACDETLGHCSASVMLQKGNRMQRAHIEASDAPVELQLAKAKTTGQTRRILEIDGFQMWSLNGMYSEGDELIGNKPIYVNEHNRLIYYCAYWGAWHIGSMGDDLSYFHDGGCGLWANFPWRSDQGEAPTGAAQSEWYMGAWHSAASAGVMSTGLTCSSYGSEANCTGSPEGCHWVGERCTAEWQVFGPNGPQFNDVGQGALGTCYFLAAIASVAFAQPQVIQDMYVEGHFDTYPVHVIKFLLTGKPILVAVDEMIPVNAADKPSFVQYDSQSLILWPLLYEKAWAKVFGSFKAVEGGWGNEALKAIAQAPVTVVLHDDIEDLWAVLVDAEAHKYPMYSATTETAPDVGLAMSHAYAVLGTGSTEIDGVSKRTVRCYNPWSVTNYNGAVDNDELHLSDGHFYMLLEEYASAFASTLVAHIHQGYVTSYQVMTTGAEAIAEMVDFQMTDDQPFAVQLEWPSFRLSREGGCDNLQPRVNVEVFKDGAPVVNTSQTQTKILNTFSNVRADVPGGAGHYTVHVRVNFPNGAWVDEIVLNTYAASQTTISAPVALPPQPAGFVEMGGFGNSALNGRYEEDPQTIVGGRETYWSSSGYFLYHCGINGGWRINFHWYLSTAQTGECSTWVGPPYAADVLQVDMPKGWWEWTGTSWVERAEAGVVSHTHNHPSVDLPTTTTEILLPPTTTTTTHPAPTTPAPEATTPLPVHPVLAVALHGFSDADMNGNYTEQSEDELKVSGNLTYWKDDGSGYYIYFCVSSGDWRVTDRSISIQQGGGCLSQARCSVGVDILDPAAASGWKERVGNTWQASNGGVSWTGVAHAALLQAQDPFVPRTAGVARASLLKYRSRASHASGLETCKDVLDRLDTLGNTASIIQSRSDDLFPADLSSIANDGETCGDTAQGIADSCESYNNWKALSDIMADARR
mmetsp:Transcript_66672/g.124506  ORF Transcript_66672/g.124506 Transcript_66672/m.124506 type:complete len:966 (-) Transcript_66672:55-2952(-)